MKNILKNQISIITLVFFLTKKKKKVNFYSRKLTGDSYYREQSDRYDKDRKPETIITTTLDEIVKKRKISNSQIL